MKTISSKSCSVNVFVGSDLTLDPPFKVKLVFAIFSPFIVCPKNFVCEEEPLHARSSI